VPEYIISQHDPRGERTEQLAAVKAAPTYNMEYGFPVSTGPDDDGPSPAAATTPWTIGWPTCHRSTSPSNNSA
jgi:hypothetical protein